MAAMPAASPSTPSIRLKALVRPTSHAAVTGHASQPSGHVHPSSVTRSISRPDDIDDRRRRELEQQLRHRSRARARRRCKPTRKIRPPAIKNGPHRRPGEGIDGVRDRTAATSNRPENRGQDHGHAAQARDGTGMNLPPAWGVYQSKPASNPVQPRGSAAGPGRHYSTPSSRYTVNANRRYRNRRSGPQPAHAVPRGCRWPRPGATSI